MKHLLWVLLILSISNPTYAIEGLLGFPLGGTKFLVCSIPETPEKGVIGKSYCVVHDINRKLRCNYNYNTEIMRCFRMEYAI